MDRLKKVMLHLFTESDEEEEEKDDNQGVISDRAPDGRRYHS
jgi:hypothetical protein